MDDHGKKECDSYFIRELRDTEEDAAFAGKMVNTTFCGSTAYAYPQCSVQQIDAFLSNDFKNKPKELYKRSFVLQAQDENAGFLQLMFHDSPPEKQSFKHAIKSLGIRGTFWWMTGSIIMNKLVKIEPGTAYLNYLAVEENHRKRGYGKALLHKADEFAISRNCTKIGLLLVTGNTGAQSLYEKHGYVAVKRNISVFGLVKFYWGFPSFIKYEKELQMTK